MFGYAERPFSDPHAGRLANVAAACLLGGVLGCSVILDPERLDDVQRCRYDDDCSPPEDERFENVCTAEPDPPDRDYPKICAPRPAASCDPEQYDFDSLFRTRYREATTDLLRYEDRCEELGGVQGCGPKEGKCEAGLVIHPLSKRCDDDDPLTPPALAPDLIVVGQDVRDQFCRSLYCNFDFVCDTSLDRCRPCELGKSLGRGGCGELYFEGERSAVYQDADALYASCEPGPRTAEDVYIGPISEGT